MENETEKIVPIPTQKQIPIFVEPDVDPLAGLASLPDTPRRHAKPMSLLRNLVAIGREGQISAARGKSVNSNPYRPRNSIAWHAWDKGWQKEYAKPQLHISRGVAKRLSAQIGDN
jgi:hypothetical protein